MGGESLAERLRAPDLRVRHAAAHECATRDELPRECVAPLIAAVASDEMWVEHGTDPWGGYVDEEMWLVDVAAQALGRHAVREAFLPIARAAVARGSADEHWLGWALERIDVPDEIDVDVFCGLFHVRGAPRDTLRRWLDSTIGKSVDALLSLLFDPHDEIAANAMECLRARKKELGDRRGDVVAALRRKLRNPRERYPMWVIMTIFDVAASASDVIDAVVEEFLARDDLPPREPGIFGVEDQAYEKLLQRFGSEGVVGRVDALALPPEVKAKLRARLR